MNHKVFQVNLLTKGKEAVVATTARATVIEAEPEVKTYKMNERSRKILEQKAKRAIEHKEEEEAPKVIKLVKSEKILKQTKDHSMKLLTDKFDKEWKTVLEV